MTKELAASVANNAAAREIANLSASTMPTDILTIIYGAVQNSNAGSAGTMKPRVLHDDDEVLCWRRCYERLFERTRIRE